MREVVYLELVPPQHRDHQRCLHCVEHTQTGKTPLTVRDKPVSLVTAAFRCATHVLYRDALSILRAELSHSRLAPPRVERTAAVFIALRSEKF